MSEHTPTADDVQEQFVAGSMVTGFSYSRDEARDDWETWLAQERAQAAAQALRDAANDVQDWYTDTRTYWDWLNDRAARIARDHGRHP